MIKYIGIVLQALWFILPAYFANATPVVVGGGYPIDGGRKLPDGNRILGDGKTVRGFVLGLITGSVIGLIQTTFWSRSGGLEISVLLALGALTGDLIGSFIKRRAGIKRGGSVLGLDQLEFLMGAILFGSIVEIPKLEIILVLVIITPLLHLGTNHMGYKVGFKGEPY